MARNRYVQNRLKESVRLEKTSKIIMSKLSLSLSLLQGSGKSPFPGGPGDHAADVVIDSVPEDEPGRFPHPLSFVLTGCLLPPC